MKKPAVTMSGAQLGARVVVLEAFIMILIEAHCDRPEISPEDGKSLIEKMATKAKELSTDLGHPEVKVQSDMFVDDLTDRLMDMLPDTRDGAPA